MPLIDKYCLLASGVLLCSSFCFGFVVCPILVFVGALLFGGWLFWVSCVVFVVVAFTLFIWRLLSIWVVVFLAGPVQTFVENAGVCSRSVGNGSHALFSVFLRWEFPRSLIPKAPDHPVDQRLFRNFL